MKTYLGISRDHSGSMQSLSRAAATDYNQNIEAVKQAALTTGQDTVVSVVSCGIRSGVRREVVNSSVNALAPLGVHAYVTDGQTPLFDSIGELITILEGVPDARDPAVSFLVMAITDGAENASRVWNSSRLMAKIRQLQMTDRWTFVFRVPRGGKFALTALGIPDGNILEWETTERGLAQSTRMTQQAVAQYYTDVSQGRRATSRFYTDLSHVSQAEVQQTLEEISGQIWLFSVAVSQPIKEFILQHGVSNFQQGCAFYQLTKPETVQGYKQVVLRHRHSGKFYGGQNARNLLGLPPAGDMRVHPGNHGTYDVFVQSTSVNRKLMPGTSVVYWPGVGR